MEEKFCLKSRKELDEIRESKKQVNEISDKLVGKVGRKIDQQFYQAKGEEIEAADKLSRGTGDMGTLIKASQKADNKLARANRFWKLADKRKARKQVGESKINEGVTKSNYNEIIKTLSDTLAKAAKENPDARLVKNYQATTGSTGVYFDEGLHFRGKGAVLKAVSVSEKLQEAMKKYDFKLFRSESMSYKLGNDKASSIISFGVESQGDNGATVGYNIKKDNLKFLESKINEGVHGVKVLKNTLEEIELLVEFDNGKEETEYYVECYLVGDDTDTYSIRVYDGLHHDVNPHNANEVMNGLFDSDGGSFSGMEVEIGENDYNFDHMGELENLILDVLFNERNGIVTKYQEELSNRLAESKINEISDETVYNAVAKAQDRALKSLRKDSDKRNFLRDADKLNNIYNAGLRREWRKKGLKNPVGMSAKQLGKVWDKDYEPVKNEYERQLKKRHKVDAFGNDKKQVDEGAGSAVIFEFEKADFNIPRVEDKQVIAEVEDLTLASAYDRGEAPNGGFVVFDLDDIKNTIVDAYNQYDRFVEDPEITVEDIADVKYVSVEHMPNLSYSWGWSRIELPKDVVLTWGKHQLNGYLPSLEVGFTDKQGEEHTATTVIVDGEYHISEDVYYAYQGLDNYEDEEYDESLTAKKALTKSKTILEEYGEYQDDPNFEEIARQLEQGNTYGSTYETEWGEVEINGTPISDLLKTDEVIDWVLRELSYPVRDGHAYYNGLDCIFYSYGDTIDHTNEDVIADLVALGFDETEIREMPVIKDPADVKEIETWIDYDINYKEPEEDEDEEYDESLTEAKVKPETLKAQLEEEIKKFFKYEPDALDWAFVEITEEEGRTRVEVRAELDYNGMWALSDALDPIVQKYDKDAYFEQEQPGIMTAYIENKKGLGERKIRSHRRKAIAEAKSKKMPKGDLILKLVHQVTKNDKGESAHVKYDWDKKEYNIEDQETGEILVSGKPNDIIKWAESKGAKQPAKDPGFAIDGAETLDQVYARNWNRAMSKMAKNESKINENNDLVKALETMYPKAKITYNNQCIEVEDENGEVIVSGDYKVIGQHIADNRAKMESKMNEEIRGNNLNSRWVIRAWMDNMDSEDGYGKIEFTKIGLIDFINSEEKDYYGDSYDYQAEPVEYDITDEELKTAINDNVFAWVFGDTASVVSIDGKPVNEALEDDYTEIENIAKNKTILYYKNIRQKEDPEEITSAEFMYIVRHLIKTDTPVDVNNKIAPDKSLITWLDNGVVAGVILKGKDDKNETNLSRKGKSLMNAEKTSVRGEGEKSESKINENDGWKTDIWKATFKKGDKIIVNRKGAEKEYIYHSKDPGIYGEDMHSVVDMTQKPRMLTHIHTADIARYKNMDESMFNKYGEEVNPKEWENKEARGLNEAKSNEVNIFLTNLGKYNEGELVGEWVELPVDDFQPILDRIGINDEYEEWFITDYEAPFEINEYDNIEELNDIAREIQDFDSTQLEVLDAYKENGYDMQDAVDKVIENDYFYLEGNTEEDLAYSYIDVIGSFEDAVSKEDKQYYFDYEAYGRDLVLGGDYSYVDDAVDLNSFADKDTAEMIFGSYGEDLPSEDDIAKYKKWIEIYNDYTDEQEEELAKQGIEVFMSSIYVDEVAYDVETLEQVVGEDYEVQSGYKDYEGNIVNVSSEKELAEYVVDDLFGGVDQMSEDEIERYFDYAWWGKTLAYDFYKTDNGWVQLD